MPRDVGRKCKAVLVVEQGGSISVRTLEDSFLLLEIPPKAANTAEPSATRTYEAEPVCVDFYMRKDGEWLTTGRDYISLFGSKLTELLRELFGHDKVPTSKYTERHARR